LGSRGFVFRRVFGCVAVYFGRGCLLGFVCGLACLWACRECVFVLVAAVVIWRCVWWWFVGSWLWAAVFWGVWVWGFVGRIRGVVVWVPGAGLGAFVLLCLGGGFRMCEY